MQDHLESAHGCIVVNLYVRFNLCYKMYTFLSNKRTDILYMSSFFPTGKQEQRFILLPSVKIKSSAVCVSWKKVHRVK